MKKIYFLLFLLFFITFIYFLPAGKKDFLDIYQHKDGISEQLIAIQKESLNKIVINNIEWNYIIKKAKKPSTSTILFLHGMTGKFDIWWQQYYFFQEEYNVISYTLPESIRTLKDASEGILKILEKENIDKVILVGSSMGGYIAQYFLKMYPEKIEKAVFGNTFPPNSYLKDQNEFKAKLLFFLPEILFNYIGKQNFKKVILPTSLYSKPLEAYLLSFQNPKQQFLNRYKIVTDFFNIEPRTKEEILIPKLIIISENDPLIPKFLRDELIKTYPEASVFSFPEEGHFPYVVSPQKYNQIVLEFIKKN